MTRSLPSQPHPHWPADQASGLRRLFGATRRRVLPVLANPFVPAGQALLEALCAVLAAQGRQVLVADVASTAPAPHESALFDLAAGVETLHTQISYLGGHGLPLAYVDSRGSATTFVDAAFAAAPMADVLVLHADVTDMARLLGRRRVRPLLLGSDRAESLTQAYAGIKLLVQRCGLMSFDLLMAARPGSARSAVVAERLASCAEGFLGAEIEHWAVLNPRLEALAVHDVALNRLVAAQLAFDDDVRCPPAGRLPLAAVAGAGVSALQPTL